jgi:hypothetical protein
LAARVVDPSSATCAQALAEATATTTDAEVPVALLESRLAGLGVCSAAHQVRWLRMLCLILILIHCPCRGFL